MEHGSGPPPNSIDDLVAKISAFIKKYNLSAKPYEWTHAGKPLKVA